MGEYDTSSKKTSETILREYLSKNYLGYPKEVLKKEILSKGYPQSLFEKIYREVTSIKSIPNLPPVQNSNYQGDIPAKIVKQDGKEIVMLPIEKDKLIKAIKETNKPSSFFAPTQVMTYAFCIILLVTIGVSIAGSFSLKSLVYQDQGQEFVGQASFFEVGYPLVYISFSLDEADPFVFRFWNFILDFFLYLILAYLIDLAVSNSYRAIKSSIKQENLKEKRLEEKELFGNPAIPTTNQITNNTQIPNPKGPTNSQSTPSPTNSQYPKN